MRRYFISILLANYNSLSLLKKAIESLKNQSYKNFELIVIDNKSNDGSVEYLEKQSKRLKIKIVSEKDKGISDAYSKGLRLVAGEIVGIFSVDERYYPNTLKKVNKWYNDFPKKIVCAGNCQFIDKKEKVITTFKNKYINLKEHLRCDEIIAINTCFFNRSILKKELYYNNKFKTCMDYELWARLLLKYKKTHFKFFDTPIVQSKLTDDSMSFRSDSFNQMVSDKIGYLDFFLKNNKSKLLIKGIKKKECIAGINLWAAIQLKYINGNIDQSIKYLNRCYKNDPKSKVLKKFVKENNIKVNIKKNKIIKDEPNIKNKSYKVNDFQITFFNGAKKKRNNLLQTSSNPWEYSIECKINPPVKDSKYKWMEIIVYLVQGTISLGLYKKNKLYQETVIKHNKKNTKMLFKITDDKRDIMFRNADFHKHSVFKINKVRLIA